MSRNAKRPLRYEAGVLHCGRESYELGALGEVLFMGRPTMVT